MIKSIAYCTQHIYIYYTHTYSSSIVCGSITVPVGTPTCPFNCEEEKMPQFQCGAGSSNLGIGPCDS